MQHTCLQEGRPLLFDSGFLEDDESVEKLLLQIVACLVEVDDGHVGRQRGRDIVRWTRRVQEHSELRLALNLVVTHLWCF